MGDDSLSGTSTFSEERIKENYSKASLDVLDAMFGFANRLEGAVPAQGTSLKFKSKRVGGLQSIRSAISEFEPNALRKMSEF